MYFHIIMSVIFGYRYKK